MYISLFSNTRSLGSEDTISNFETELNSNIPLQDGDYECALVAASIPAAFEIITPENAYITLTSQKYQKREADVELSGENFIETINIALRGNISIESAGVRNKFKFVQGNSSRKKISEVSVKHDGKFFSGDNLEFSVPINTIFELEKRTDTIPMTSAEKNTIKFILFNKSIDHTSQENRIELKRSCRNLKHLISVINKQMKSQLNIDSDVFTISPDKYIAFKGFTGLEQIGKTYRYNQFTLSEQLLGILGFNIDHVFGETPLEGSRLPDFTAGFKYAIVTSPIVENQFIGSDSIPVLAVIPLDRASDTNIINFEPRHLAYKKILNKDLSTIRVSVYNEVGSLLRYISDKTHPLVLTLHIRKVLRNESTWF
jgi:hypothetical protein